MLQNTIDSYHRNHALRILAYAPRCIRRYADIVIRENGALINNVIERTTEIPIGRNLSNFNFGDGRIDARSLSTL